MQSESATTQPVWALWVRLLHWALALCTIASFATHEGGGRWHEWLGYAALALACLRIALGFALPGYGAFAQFVRGLRFTWAYVRAIASRCEPRYVGHNPLGGWMVLALLGLSVATGVTGWLYTTDRFWGVAWVGDLHNFLGHAFVPLVLLHVVGAVFTSRRHRENLIASMLHGRKRAAGPKDMA